jgi:hypothetical protein
MMVTLILALGITLENGEFRQNVEPCMYAYCAETREEAEEINQSETASFLIQIQKKMFSEPFFAV